jgi:hypothetical protein
VEVGVSFRGGGSVFLVSSFGAVSLSLFGVVWFEFSVLRFVGEFCGSTSVAGGDRRTLPVRTAVV